MTNFYVDSAPFVVEGVRFDWGDTADPDLAGLDWVMPTNWSVTVTAPLDHAAAIRLTDNYRPAARDYRRRTKHRRRRQRGWRP